MEVKFGKIKPSNNIFVNLAANSSEENFFASNQGSKKEKKRQKTSATRINDYDSKLLEDNAYRDMPDEMFKIEHKLGILEETLSKIISEIETLESFGYAIQVTALKERKQRVEQELIELNKEYSRLGLSTKISGQIASAVDFTSKRKKGLFSRLKAIFPRKILAKISKKFNFNQFMKESLQNLSTINSSVDELVNIQIPYGETGTRYERLTAYLNKANVIHSKISRNLNTITDKA